ncbi:MAG: bifunctional phosphopantothenoylcysteine decarboxylase/phosphopantothenate--cysteine ligase CoaBC, partial [Ignavibacteriaceae bacterium]|nr:bifunctional phosphopantothenoylcysteine decarboxylase/phosphopantothenate--cysteine ligase CoaBC [Ignavibacteriaceae bacterium]
ALSTWHIDYVLWADLMLISPATVNTIAKIANGFADNALTTLVTALRSPLIVAPAADVDMYKNKITQENIKRIESFGNYIVYAEEGELASGLVGEGRLADINKIIDSVELVLSGYTKDLTGKKILVSAGPTYEDIDPVRYLGNRSSGKMGFALAKAAFLRGADVTVISGPSNEIPYPEINLKKIRSTQNMFTAVKNELQKNDILIMAAAVADYKPAKTLNKKIKKGIKVPDIKLTGTKDILSSLNSKGKTIVGFALETDNELVNAKKKLNQKNLDMIILNSLKEKGTGFESDTNKVTILRKRGKAVKLPLLSKFQVANKILNEINSL